MPVKLFLGFRPKSVSLGTSCLIKVNMITTNAVPHPHVPFLLWYWGQDRTRPKSPIFFVVVIHREAHVAQSCVSAAKAIRVFRFKPPLTQFLTNSLYPTPPTLKAKFLLPLGWLIVHQVSVGPAGYQLIFMMRIFHNRLSFHNMGHCNRILYAGQLFAKPRSKCHLSNIGCTASNWPSLASLRRETASAMR